MQVKTIATDWTGKMAVTESAVALDSCEKWAFLLARLGNLFRDSAGTYTKRTLPRLFLPD